MPEQQPAQNPVIHLLYRYQLYAIVLIALVILLSACTEGSSSGGSTEAPPTSQPVIGNSSFAPANVEVSWSLPLLRADGSPMEMGDLGGIELLTVNSDTSQQHAYTVDSNTSTSFTITQLTPANYEIFVFIYDSNDIISAPARVAISVNDFPAA